MTCSSLFFVLEELRLQFLIYKPFSYRRIDVSSFRVRMQNLAEFPPPATFAMAKLAGGGELGEYKELDHILLYTFPYQYEGNAYKRI